MVTSFSASRKLKNPESKIPEPVLEYNGTKLKRPETGPSGEPLRSGRIPRVTRKNQVRPDPREWYGPPPARPESWGPKDKGGRPLFKYTECGELERGKTYTAREMRQFIYGPKSSERFAKPEPLPGVPIARGLHRQGLTLWIGWVPAQSNDRYPYDALSQKCRFKDCPEPKNTIRSGFPRVIFDERYNVDGDIIDVFHNAGYAHLFCLEKHFDLIGTMQVVNVRPDHRDFKREDNLCKLSRQFSEIQEDVDGWYQVQLKNYLKAKAIGKPREWVYEDTLGYCLVQHAIAHLPEIRAKVRESRAGADISKHLGNLETQAFLNECKRYNLTDRDGNPVENARELLKNMTKRARPGPRPRQRGTPVTPVQQLYHPDYASNFGSPESHGTPYVTPSPATCYESPMSSNMSPAPGYAWPGPDSVIQPMPVHSYQEQVPPPTVDNSAQKRTNDEALAEDRQISSQTVIQENPAKKPRLEEPGTTQTEDAPAWDAQESRVDGLPEMPPPGAGDFDSFEPFDSSQGLEPDLDLDAAFDIIDNEIPSKSPSGEQQPSVDALDSLAVEEDDLFGDGNETPDAEQPIPREDTP